MTFSASSFDVSEWLQSFGLGEYSRLFKDNGYETFDLCADLLGEDLDVMDITNPMHREAIFYQAKQLTSTDKAPDKSSPPKTLPDQITAPEAYTDPWVGDSSYSEPWTSGFALKKSVSPKFPRKKVKPSHLKPLENKGTMGGGGGGKLPSGSKSPKVPAANVKLPRMAETASESQAPRGRLTKLQLKLKLREEILRDHIDLADGEYHTEVRNSVTTHIHAYIQYMCVCVYWIK